MPGHMGDNFEIIFTLYMLVTSRHDCFEAISLNLEEVP